MIIQLHIIAPKLLKECGGMQKCIRGKQVKINRHAFYIPHEPTQCAFSSEDTFCANKV